MSTISQRLETATQETEAAAAQNTADSAIMHAIMHGPASGEGSEVETEGGNVPTVAKALADMQDNTVNGWTPELASVADGERRVFQVVDWQGGTGTKPATGMYLGSDGFVSDIGDAVDVRGGEGAQGDKGDKGDQGDPGEDGDPGAVFPSPSQTTTVSVSVGGSDETGDGKPNTPFRSVKAAMDSITDASPAKPYLINVGPGLFADAINTLTFKPNVTIRGVGVQLTLIHYATYAFGNSTVDQVNVWAISELSIQRYGGGGVETSTPGGHSLSGSNVFWKNVNWTSNAFRLDLDSTVQSSRFEGCTFSQALDLRSGTHVLFNSQADSIQANQSSGPNLVIAVGCRGSTARSFGTGASDPNILELHSSPIVGQIFALNNGTLKYDSVSSTPAKEVVQGGSPTFVQLSMAEDLAYIPADSSKWDGDPATVKEALDRIAAVVGLVTPIP